jgi:hypothetical protein
MSPSPLQMSVWSGLFCRANTALLLIKMDHLCQHPQPLIYYLWHFSNSPEQCLKGVSYGSMKSANDRLQRAYQTQARELYMALICRYTSFSAKCERLNIVWVPPLLRLVSDERQVETSVEKSVWGWQIWTLRLTYTKTREQRQADVSLLDCQKNKTFAVRCRRSAITLVAVNWSRGNWEWRLCYRLHICFILSFHT